MRMNSGSREFEKERDVAGRAREYTWGEFES
jgi:hypothetical protein